MRFKRIGIVISLLLLLFTVHLATARDVIRGNDCVIDSDRVIEGNAFILCRTFTLNGRITGNLIGAAFDVELNGPVDGDIYMLAGQMDVRSEVGRNLLFAGPVLRVHATSSFEDDRGDLMTASLSTLVSDGATIPGSVISLSYQALVNGDVGGEISFWGSALRISGTVTGDVDANVGDAELADASQLQTLLTPFRFDVQLIPPGLTVTEDAVIEGNLTYSSTSPGDIYGELANSPTFVQVSTSPDFTQINNTDDESNVTWITGYLSVVVREFITLGAIGILGLYLVPRALQAPVPQIRHRPINSLGAGILTFILSIGVWVLVLLIIILITLLFLTLNLPDLVIVGMIGLGVVNIGGASAFYFIAIYISRIIVSLAVGRLLVRLALGDDRMAYLNLLTGVALLALVVFIPVLGTIVNGVALALGLGAIFLTIAQFRGFNRPRAAPVTIPSAPEDARQMPPPIVEDAPRGPGMDNLPAGFRWWNDRDK